MKKVIKLTESDLVRIVKRVIKENEDDSNPVEKKIPLSIERWDQLWDILRKYDRGFHQGNRNQGFFDFGGLEFIYNPETGFLELPPQKLSDWRDDKDRAREILENFVARLRKALYESELNLKVSNTSNFEMKIYAYQED